MLNICVLDDDAKEALQNKQFVEKYFLLREIEYSRIDVYQNGHDLLVSPTVYDILFLDMEVGKENGIAIAKELRKRDQDIIIIVITSYVKYSIEGYKINAARYLLKPLSPSLLYSELDEVFKTSFPDKVIVLEHEGTQHRLAVNSIYYFEAFGRKTRFYTKSHVYISNETVSTWSLKLPKTFMECYKGLYLHLKYIESISKDMITLDNMQELPLARRRTDTIKEAWTQYQEQSI